MNVARNDFADFAMVILGLIALILILAGGFFIYLGLSGLDNSLTVAAGAAMGSAFLVAAILLIVVIGFTTMNQTLSRQAVYLHYLAEQEHERTRKQDAAATPKQ